MALNSVVLFLHKRHDFKIYDLPIDLQINYQSSAVDLFTVFRHCSVISNISTILVPFRNEQQRL